MNESSFASPARATIAFDRSAAGLTPLVVKGVLLSLITFTVYRFWFVTDLRRFFWSRTIVLGSPAQYLGRGKELFLGFLIALAVLVPVYALVFLLTFASPEIASFSGLISFVVLFLLGQFAIYRGRRYRASRTLWRGIRLSQDGSAMTYAVMAAGWYLLSAVSIGLAFPFMRASLERYRINHTLVGESRLSSTARGTTLLKPWLLCCLIAVAPLLLVALGLLATNKFALPASPFPPLVAPAGPDAKPGDIPVSLVAGILSTVAVALVLPIVLVVPYYRARETRAFVSATSLGESGLICTLQARQFYGPYLRFILWSIGIALAYGFVLALVGATQDWSAGPNANRPLVVLAIALSYLGGLMVFAVLYIRVVTVRLWHAVATTTMITNPHLIEAVLASSRPAGSGFNEGLADALDLAGAIEIGF